MAFTMEQRGELAVERARLKAEERLLGQGAYSTIKVQRAQEIYARIGEIDALIGPQMIDAGEEE